MMDFGGLRSRQLSFALFILTVLGCGGEQSHLDSPGENPPDEPPKKSVPVEECFKYEDNCPSSSCRSVGPYCRTEASRYLIKFDDEEAPNFCIPRTGCNLNKDCPRNHRCMLVPSQNRVGSSNGPGATTCGGVKYCFSYSELRVSDPVQLCRKPEKYDGLQVRVAAGDLKTRNLCGEGGCLEEESDICRQEVYISCDNNGEPFSKITIEAPSQAGWAGPECSERLQECQMRCTDVLNLSGTVFKGSYSVSGDSNAPQISVEEVKH